MKEKFKATVPFMEIYQRIQQATNTRTQSETAKVLGVHQPSIADAKRRNVIPAHWYLLLFEKFGLSQEWLRYGVGPMYSRTKRGDAPQALPAAGEQADFAIGSDPAAKSLPAAAYSMHCPHGGVCSVAMPTKEKILSAISELEAKQTPRMLRGAALGKQDDQAMLMHIEAEIAELRKAIV